MTEPSLQPRSGWGKGRRLRQRQAREAIEEARAAFLESRGRTTPVPLVSFPWVRRRVFVLGTIRARVYRRFRTIHAPNLLAGRYPATFVVMLLLASTVVSRGFGIHGANPASSDTGGGGPGLLIRGQDAAAIRDSVPFAFSAAPMTVAYRRYAAYDTPPAPEAAEPADVGETLRSDVVTYTVETGDTLDSIAAQFEVAPYTIFWVNELHTPQEVQPGTVLTIPPLDGVPHPVRSGETLDSVAALYGVRPGNIVGYPPNRLKYPYELRAGQVIFVPGGMIEIPTTWVDDGERPPPTLAKMPGGEKLAWPTWGEITAPFGWSRAYGGYHRGLDIANDWGTPIYAAAAGTVVEAGWGPLGWYVAIDHGNGFRTEYGHLAEQPWVSEGDTVEKGQRIGSMGRTYGKGGYASGVHLHFAVRHLGVLIDPWPLLDS